MSLPGGKFKFAIILGAVLLFAGGLGFLLQKSPRKRPICAIQGDGDHSPYLDQAVITRGLVSWIDPENAGLALIGSGCSDPGETSRGIYVNWQRKAIPFQVGDEVQVQAVVREIEGETRLEVLPGKFRILSLDNPLPAPVDLSQIAPSESFFQFENWEGQLITIPGGVLSAGRHPDGSYPLIPEILPGEADLICFQADGPGLRIIPDGSNVVPEGWLPGVTLVDIVGLLRQDRSGYLLQLITLPALADSSREGPLEYPYRNPLPSTTPSCTAEIETQSATIPASPAPSQTPSQTIVPSPTFYSLPLLITEILPNPTGEEPAGEWIEIHNPGGTWLPLTGVKLGDETSPGGKEGMLRFPDGYRIDSGQVLVIANRSRSFEAVYGFRPDFELEDSDPRVPDLLPYPDWGRSKVQLSNTGDQVLLVSPWDQVLDLVAYGEGGAAGMASPPPAPKEGNSIERYPPGLDRDQGSDWRERDLPSPGWLDMTPPTLAASETVPILPTPSETPTIKPSWRPSLTPTPSPSSTASLPASPTSGTPTLAESSTLTGTPTITPSPSQARTGTLTGTPAATPSPSQPVQTATSWDSSTPHLTASATATPPITLTPSPTELSCTETAIITEETPPTPSLRPASPTALAGTPTPIISPTRSPTLVSPSPTHSATGEGASSTPTESATPVASGIVLINEIHADPDPILGDSNRDGEVNSDDDEFLELVNISGMDLDLAGWSVFDGVRCRFTFPEGTTLKAGCPLVLFGGGEPEDDFGGSLVFTAGSLGLNNSGDLVAIRDAEGNAVVSCLYGPEGGQNQSLTRYPDLFSGLPLALHGEIPEAEGALYSPGYRLDGSAFGDCP